MRNFQVKLDLTGIKVKSMVTTDEKTAAIREVQQDGGYTWVG